MVGLIISGTFLTTASGLWAVMARYPRALKNTSEGTPPSVGHQTGPQHRHKSAHTASAPRVIAVTLLTTGLTVACLGLNGWSTGAALGLAWCIGYGKWQTLQRQRALDAQLPDALLLMATSLKAGLGIAQAIQLVADEGEAPLAQEFERLSQELRLGASLPESLKHLAVRLGSDDGVLFCQALAIQRETGGALTAVLQHLHTTIRDRQRLHAQITTLTAQGRLSAIILIALPIAVALAIQCIQPAYLAILYQDARGQLLIGIALTLTLLGGLVIRRIVTINW